MSNIQLGILMIARCLIASYFLKAGISNFRNYNKVIHAVRAKPIPLPRLALAIVIIIEIFGSLAIIFNQFAIIGAIGLIIFTLLSNIYYCNYWTMKGADRRNINFLFYAHVAIIGGLLLIIALSL